MYNIPNILDMLLSNSMIFLTSVLVFITGYYAWRTQQILSEQRKAAECQLKPDISFEFSKSPMRTIQCIISRNHAFNLTVTVKIDSEFIKKDLGGIFVYPNQASNIPLRHSMHLDVQSLLERMNIGSKVLVRIRVEYLSSIGGQYIEEFLWKNCEIRKEGIIIRGYVDRWRLIKAPWYKYRIIKVPW